MGIQTGLNPDGYWYALDRNTYDCDCDQDGFFSTSPVGYGKTEQEAIDELKEQQAESDRMSAPSRFAAEALVLGIGFPILFSLLAYGRGM